MNDSFMNTYTQLCRSSYANRSHKAESRPRAPPRPPSVQTVELLDLAAFLSRSYWISIPTIIHLELDLQIGQLSSYYLFLWRVQFD